MILEGSEQFLFGKDMENVRNHRDIKNITTDKKK